MWTQTLNPSTAEEPVVLLHLPKERAWQVARAFVLKERNQRILRYLYGGYLPQTNQNSSSYYNKLTFYCVGT